MENRFMFELHQFMHSIKNYGEKMIKMHYPSITPSQLVIIKYLIDNKEKEIVQKDIEKRMNLGKSTVSSILDTMEKNELIVRISSSSDGRKKIIQANFNKLPNKEMIHQSSHMIETVLCKDIPKEKLQVFNEVLHQMNENIQKEGDYNV